MLWLNSVLSVPALGIKLDQNLQSVFDVQKKLPLFLEMFDEKFGPGKITQNEFWGYEIKSESGYSLQLSPTNILGLFQYHQKKETRAGGFPILIVPSIEIYTYIFDNIEEYVLYMLKQLDVIGGFKYNQIGMVANVSLDKDSCPPGVDALLRHLSKPWGSQIKELNTNMLLNLDVKEKYTERCHHLVKFKEEEEEAEQAGYKIVLDWQRVYNESQKLSMASIKEELVACRSEAFKYFDKFAEGDFNYE